MGISSLILTACQSPKLLHMRSDMFGFEFSYPETSKIFEDCYGKSSEECDNFNVEEDNVGTSSITIREESSSDLEAFSRKLWEDNMNEMKGHSFFNKNLPDKKVEDLKQTNFAGHDAYSFTATESFRYPGGGGDVRHYPFEVIAFGHRGKIFLVVLPVESETGRIIAQSFHTF